VRQLFPMNLFLLLLCLFLSLVTGQVHLPTSYDVIGELNFPSSSNSPNTGPFPLGMREILGMSLDAYGGVFQVPRADDTRYNSEYGDGGKVLKFHFKHALIYSRLVGAILNRQIQQKSVLLHFHHGMIPFFSNRFNPVMFFFFFDCQYFSYGWSALLWHGYAIGDFHVDIAGRYLIQVS